MWESSRQFHVSALTLWGAHTLDQSQPLSYLSSCISWIELLNISNVLKIGQRTQIFGICYKSTWHHRPSTALLPSRLVTRNGRLKRAHECFFHRWYRVIICGSRIVSRIGIQREGHCRPRCWDPDIQEGWVDDCCWVVGYIAPAQAFFSNHKPCLQLVDPFLDLRVRIQVCGLLGFSMLTIIFCSDTCMPSESIKVCDS